jgi:hypothetical protein
MPLRWVAVVPVPNPSKRGNFTGPSNQQVNGPA